MARAIFLAVCAALAITACKPKPPNELDPSAFDAIAAIAAEDMNTPVAALHDLLRASADQAQIPWDSLVITSGPQPEPVGWWMLQKGWITLAGATFVNRPVFTLSDTAAAVLAAPDEPWFDVTVVEDQDPQVDCQSPQAMTAGGCLVSVILQPALTDAGRAVLGAKTLAGVEVQTTVRAGLEDWDVDHLEMTGESLYDRALFAILGDEASRAASARAAQAQLGMRIRALDPQATQADQGPPPPNYIEPEPPVAPIAPADTKAALGLGIPR